MFNQVSGKTQILDFENFVIYPSLCYSIIQDLLHNDLV